MNPTVTSLRIPLVDLVAQYRSIKSEIDAAIQRVLDRGQFILGPEVEALERELAAYCDAAYAVTVASGTDALELALRAYGIGPGDAVITTALSFVATAEAIAVVGARPVFVDIDPVTYTIEPALVERAVTPQTKAIIPVHLYGHPCDMEALLAVAERHRLTVIEDCAQAIGATWDGRKVGTFGDAAAFSFYPSKNLGAYGDGGLVVTNDASLAERVRLLRLHGSRDNIHHEVLGRNSRLDELQAAILRVKLRHLEAWNERRRMHAATYDRALRPLGDKVMFPKAHPAARHVYHLYPVRVGERQAFREALAAEGIATQIHYPLPLHLEPAFTSLGYAPGACPHAEQAAQEIVSLPMYPELTSRQVDQITQAVAHFFSGASR